MAPWMLNCAGVAQGLPCLPGGEAMVGTSLTQGLEGATPMTQYSTRGTSMWMTVPFHPSWVSLCCQGRLHRQR